MDLKTQSVVKMVIRS